MGPDISDARARQQAAIAAFGVRALARRTIDELADDALEVLRDVLGVDLCGFLEARDGGATFTFRAGIGWRDGVVGATVPAEPGSAIAYMLTTAEPVLYADLATEERFTPPRLLLDHGVASGMGVVVYGPDGLVGVLGLHAKVSRHFTTDDANFLQAIANVLGSAIERARGDERLRRSEERFRLLAENAQDVIFRFRLVPNEAFEYVSPSIERVLGYTPQDCYTDPSLAYEMIHPDDRASMLDGGPTVLDEPAVLRYVRKDGSIIWCELHLVSIRNDADDLVAVEGICRDVTQRKDVEDHLRAAYEREREAARRLRALDAMKNSFLQAVSHELRTPLAAVYGMALTLQQSIERLEPADRDEMLARMGANARKLDRLLTDLLDLDRLLRHAMAPERKPTALIALARRVADEVDLGNRTLVIEEPEVVVAVDAPKVERVVENLLINVVRHTPEGVTVWVRALEHPSGATLVVEDDGPGIPDDLKSAIFEPFRQGPTAPRHAPGAGIGLSLAARFAELHGGRAWVEDRAGGGASFRILLPGRLPTASADHVEARGA